MSRRLAELAGAVAARDFRRFAVVGVLNTAVDIAIFQALYYAGGVNAISAKVLSAALATCTSYALTRLWAFSAREHRLSTSTVVLFALINGVGIALAAGTVALVRYGLRRDDFLSLVILANGAGIGAGMLWRFWSLRRWVFRAVPHEDGAHGPRR